MAKQIQSGTISTSFQRHAAELRVLFSCPDNGYTLDDLDALAVAIEYARRSFPAQPIATLSPFAIQQSRLAAPS
jgi:hypothetical protein